jgi:hypothetical protein
MGKFRITLALCLGIFGLLLISQSPFSARAGQAAPASPKAFKPYKLSVFAKSAHGYSAPDSIADLW